MREELRQSSRSLTLCLVVVLAVLFWPVCAWCWGFHGHRIVAVIAADNLTSAAQSHVASILGVPADRSAIAKAMEEASVRPDKEFRDQDRRTEPWHFINICLQDRRADVPARCQRGDCVTSKIEEYSKRLKEGKYDQWGAAGDLAFLIHFVGDIHQPLHAANDADRGGNCVMVDLHSRAKNLHDAWDTTIVRRLEDSIDSGRPETTAHRLEQTYAAERGTDSWIPADDISWESSQIARSDIYAPLHIPIEPCPPITDVCSNAPGRTVELNASYMDHAEALAGHQLAKAGFRLASLLNQIWVQPVNQNDAPRAANSAPAQVLSSKTVAGPIVSNRHSKIYAWPRCGTYDKMLPQNRVVFPSREAAELAGYRAAYNCP